MPINPNDPIELLRAAWLASGLSQRDFAEQVLIRNASTLERWLAGKSPIPKVVQRKALELYRKAARRQPPP